MGTRNRHLFETKRIRFITTTCKDWLPVFSDPSCFSILRDSLTFVNQKYECEILAYVLMPNHIHLVNCFARGADISDYMRDFKKFTSVQLRRKITQDTMNNLADELVYHHRQQKYKVWQDRFDDVYLEDLRVLYTKINYIHQNPVRKGLAGSAAEYSYSSAGFYDSGKDSFLKVTHYLDDMGWGSHYYYGQIK